MMVGGGLVARATSGSKAFDKDPAGPRRQQQQQRAAAALDFLFALFKHTS